MLHNSIAIEPCSSRYAPSVALLHYPGPGYGFPREDWQLPCWVSRLPVSVDLRPGERRREGGGGARDLKKEGSSLAEQPCLL